MSQVGQAAGPHGSFIIVRGVLVVPVAGVAVMIPPYVDTLAICASIGLAGRGLSMMSMRSDITAGS